jgi:hypothetical protein
MIDRRIVVAWVDELVKIAAYSSPAIISPPSPGGDGKSLSATPAVPKPPSSVIGKVLGKTNLQKTNYTRVNTQVRAPNPMLTSEQKALAPPVVRA